MNSHGEQVHMNESFVMWFNTKCAQFDLNQISENKLYNLCFCTFTILNLVIIRFIVDLFDILITRGPTHWLQERLGRELVGILNSS